MSNAADEHPNENTKRGEAAWKAAREGVAERNARAQKAGKAQRDAHERQKAAERLAAERRQMQQSADRHR